MSAARIHRKIRIRARRLRMARKQLRIHLRATDVAMPESKLLEALGDA